MQNYNPKKPIMKLPLFKKITNTIQGTVLVLLLLGSLALQAQQNYVSTVETTYSFPVFKEGLVAELFVSTEDWPGVQYVAELLKEDIKKVGGKAPAISNSTHLSDFPIIIGTMDKSPLIKQLVDTGAIDANRLVGKREKYCITVIKHPEQAEGYALVIAGSDKRGTIYGMLDLSRAMGVSPWYFWADVPVKKEKEMYVLPGLHTAGEPKVEYRGIFINDEAPALSGWVNENFGGFNSKFYAHVFELILRLKGNYIWPAMWGQMFYVEDSENAKLADKLGIVMGTSHHEPLTRAHAEWQKFGSGPWDFSKNKEELLKFWREGMERKGNTEAFVTIGMRGDGDEPMTEGTAIELLENIVKEQREIIANVTEKPADETPQIWALYKEVQDYYDKGMRVPDDVTLLLCDDNWGNIRKLPELTAKPRQGGYGIYYHYDYVGGPRNYKWINTNQIERTWEQMHLAYEYNAKKLWIVNVGDIKPMEFPISFFLDYAWNPDAIQAADLPEYYVNWAKKTFTEETSEAIADILAKYTKYNARRKPELLSPDTYSLQTNEAELIVNEYNDLARKADSIGKLLPQEYQDAYYQLVLFPVLASANVNQMYVAAAQNKWYASQKRVATNTMASMVRNLFERDKELTEFYHKEMAKGKWNHMMSQTHIGYTYWQQPKQNTAPATESITVPEKADMGIYISGMTTDLDLTEQEVKLPVINSMTTNTNFIEIFNKGNRSFDFQIKNKAKWLHFEKLSGSIKEQDRIGYVVDFKSLPVGISIARVTISGAGKKVALIVSVSKLETKDIKGFVETNDYIAMEASSYSRTIAPKPFSWEVVPNLGKTGSGVIMSPVALGDIKEVAKAPVLEYDVHLSTSGNVKVLAYFAPTINFTTGDGLKYAIGFDEQTPDVININEDSSASNWNTSVANNIKVLTSQHKVTSGNHTLKFYGISGGLVLEKLVIVTNNIPETYLGPVESKRVE